MTLYTAKIDNFSIDIERVEDSIPTALAVNSYPFKDGATVQHMGEGARVVDLSTHWLGDERHAESIRFLAHIRRPEPVILTHPFYGTMNGYIQNPRIVHDDGELNCVISFTFVEELLTTTPLPIARPLELIDESVGQTLLNAQDTVKADLGEALGDDAKLLEKELDPEKTIMEQIGNVNARTREVLSAVDRAIAKIEAVGNRIEQPFDTISSSLTFASNITGRVIGTVTDVTEKVLGVVAQTVAFPSVFIANTKTAIYDLKRTAITGVESVDGTFSISFDVAGASIGSREIKTMYTADQTNQRVFDAQLDQAPRNSKNLPTATDELIDVFSSNELERSLFATRELLDFAYQQDRDNLTPMKTTAELLARHVSTVREESATVVDKDLRGITTPLHAVTRSAGLDERYLGKIMALNEIQNPTFTTGEIKTYEE